MEKNISIAQKKQKAAYDRKHANFRFVQVCICVNRHQFKMFNYTGGHGGASKGFQKV